MEDNKQKIQAFIYEILNNMVVSDDQDIFELGVVNSLFAMQIVLFVEKEFGICFQDNDLDLENFNSINNINNFIGKKKNIIAC
ncbi:acyl carrier protein [Anaerobacterium chartisolvens]|uniref:Acyl carrier protein n=1 Tax=Anaerobacterium chartisolvens TaxID=1297424 RepID=A0A369BA09_9FIRM|nr:acyl carrier protein [Anaerobacterium chartisolvens]RCX18363.1 acyl carrier protein [Anaerobacterium chartisolvens]